MNLKFLPTRLRFNRATRGVHVLAAYEGAQIEIVISRAAIAWLAEGEGLNQDEAFTAVVKNKARLEHAAEVALSRCGDDRTEVDLELADLHLVGAAYAPAATQAGR